MRLAKKILLWTIFIAGVVVLAIFLWLRNSLPQYNGKLQLKGLTAEVETLFDSAGIPHIKAQNKADLYLAFGYLHAQERLFQMELLRRAGGGRLAEILGPDLLPTDKLFRTIGLTEYAAQSDSILHTLKGTPLYADVTNYLAGINSFLETGATPPEFSILGIPKTPFTSFDMFLISGAMAFSFSQGQKTDFIIDFINQQYGNTYLQDIALWHGDTESFIPANNTMPLQTDTSVVVEEQIRLTEAANKSRSFETIGLARGFAAIESMLPVAPLNGSNAWVLAPGKTKNKSVIFCNDTHIGYLVPQTWYEAHLTCPDFELYGHFMAGIPFALVGNKKELSWGLTMLLNDDMDFYNEEFNDKDSMMVKYKGNWQAVKIIEHTINVKGAEAIKYKVRITPHGPVVNDAFDGMTKLEPVSMLWTYTRMPNRTLEAMYGMNNATDITAFEKNLSLIHAPGLSVNYGDAEGNIAWWSCASILKRPLHVNSWTMLDGASGNDEPVGYYTFEENPHNINPESAYIYSANDWPSPIDSVWIPGYYKPQYRADRIRKLISVKNDWDVESIKTVMTDVTNDADAALYISLCDVVKYSTDNELQGTLKTIGDWNGNYELESCAPALYNRWIYQCMKLACADEMSDDLFNVFVTDHQFQRAYTQLLVKDSSLWWNNIRTPENETRTQVIEKALQLSIDELSAELGDNPVDWKWKRVTTLEFQHPFGKVALLKPFFNIGPGSQSGGNETICQNGFKSDSVIYNKVYFGSQMRILFDYSDPTQALNITPCGQSGHLLSKHYDDQSERYLRHEFRPLIMNTENITAPDVLILYP